MVTLLHQRTLDRLCRFKHNSESQKSLANETPELRRRTQGELGKPMYHNWPHLVLIHKPSIHSKTKLLHFIVQWSESTLCQRKPHVASVVMSTVLYTHTRAHTCWHTQPTYHQSHTLPYQRDVLIPSQLINQPHLGWREAPCLSGWLTVKTGLRKEEKKGPFDGQKP